MSRKKETKYGDQWAIWYTPPKGWECAAPGWVTDTERSELALYASEKDARRDVKGFVNPDNYEVRPYRP